MLKISRRIFRLSQANTITRPFSSKCSDKVQSLAIEPEDDLYHTFLKEDFKRLYTTGYQNRIPGFATPKGTKYYSLRSELVSENHFRKPYHDDLTISSLGIGTYVGSPDELDDLKMFNAIVESVQTGGVNVIDTAINYRYQKSERVVGAAIRYLLEKGFQRDELFIASKNGYVPEDADKGISSQILINQLIESKLITEEDVAGACHSLHPAFLENQLEASLTNLGLEALDLYYLHNAAESQLPLIGREKFFSRLAAAFEFCEKQVQKGKIKSYGLASWICFRAKPEEENIYLKIQEVSELAKKVGGAKNNLKYLQVPANLAMPESFAEKWQQYNDNGKIINENVFQVARRCRLNIITSSPLAQGVMIQVPLTSDIFKVKNLGAKHIQFARSLPAEALLSTLVGQKTSRHVKKNLELIQAPPLTTEEFMEFLKPTKRVAKPEEAVDMDE